MFYHEVRKDLIRYHDPIVVEVGEVVPPSEYNFRSTFDWPEEVANLVMAKNNTKDLKGLPVSCAEIYIDVDENEHVDEARNVLLELGIEFDEYRTGNRGKHFHVPLAERVTGVDVIYSVTSWLKDVGLWHLIDSSVYRECGIFRMETATHQKTGKPKVLTNEHYGDKLVLEIRKEPPMIKNNRNYGSGTKSNFFLNLMQQRGVGQRHMHLFICFRAGMSAGFTEEEVREALLEWNARQDNPHKEADVEKKLRGFK